MTIFLISSILPFVLYRARFANALFNGNTRKRIKNSRMQTKMQTICFRFGRECTDPEGKYNTESSLTYTNILDSIHVTTNFVSKCVCAFRCQCASHTHTAPKPNGSALRKLHFSFIFRSQAESSSRSRIKIYVREKQKLLILLGTYIFRKKFSFQLDYKVSDALIQAPSGCLLCITRETVCVCEREYRTESYAFNLYKCMAMYKWWMSCTTNNAQISLVR